MPYYKVRHKTEAGREYPCGPQDDAEAAILHFNTEYGPTVGKTFTTLAAGTASADYELIGQERSGPVGLHEIRSIPLFETMIGATESRPTGAKAEVGSFAPPSGFQGVEAEAGSLASPPHGWMNLGDSADQIPRMVADRSSRFAAMNSGPAGPVGPPVTVTPEPAASKAPTTVELTARSTMVAHSSAGLGVNASSSAVGSQGIFAGRLSERPAEIRDAARALSKAIADQIEQLKASTPNDESLTKHNDFVAFLEMIATGLAQLADSLDRSIAAGTKDSPEPILLGKAGEIARQLGIVVTEGRTAPTSSIAQLNLVFALRASSSYRLAVWVNTLRGSLPPL